MEWHDALFAKVMGLALEIDPHKITYTDLEGITELCIGVDDNTVAVTINRNYEDQTILEVQNETITNFSDLKYLTNLRYINFAPYSSFSDFDIFNQMPNLKEFSFLDTKLAKDNFENIIQLKHIEKLYFKFFDADFSVFENMHNLKELHFKYIESINTPKYDFDKIANTMPKNQIKIYFDGYMDF